MTLYLQNERFNDKFPIAVYGEDGFVKARFTDEVSAEQWATRNRYVIAAVVE